MRTCVWLLLPILVASCARRDATGRAAPTVAPPRPALSESTVPTVRRQSADTTRLVAFDSTDMVVAGVALGMDSAAVVGVLGVPSKVTTYEDPRGTGLTFSSWYYPDLTLAWGAGTGLGGTNITGPRVGTARGLKVGDSEARVIQLYGEPHSRYQDEWYYGGGDRLPDNEGLTVSVTDHRVTHLYVGVTID